MQCFVLPRAFLLSYFFLAVARLAVAFFLALVLLENAALALVGDFLAAEDFFVAEAFFLA